MSIKFIKTSVLYFTMGIGLGLYMGVTGQQALESAHAHPNLLGRVSQVLIGEVAGMFLIICLCSFVWNILRNIR